MRMYSALTISERKGVRLCKVVELFKEHRTMEEKASIRSFRRDGSTTSPHESEAVYNERGNAKRVGNL